MFGEHNWAKEEVKIIGMQGAAACRGSSGVEVEITSLKDLSDVELIPRVEIDSMVGDNGKVLNWEF